jgi:hypothetical protein
MNGHKLKGKSDGKRIDKLKDEIEMDFKIIM